MYRIDGHHPAIISEEQFVAAMAVKERRGRATSRRTSTFSGKVWCGQCGSKAASHHTVSRSLDPNRLYWTCNARHHGKSDCKCPHYRDDRLHEAADALGLENDQIDKIMLHENKIVFSLMNGRTATWKQQ